MCKNPRHSTWNKEDKLTLQERKFNDKFNRSFEMNRKKIFAVVIFVLASALIVLQLTKKDVSTMNDFKDGEPLFT